MKLTEWWTDGTWRAHNTFFICIYPPNTLWVPQNKRQGAPKSLLVIKIGGGREELRGDKKSIFGHIWRIVRISSRPVASNPRTAGKGGEMGVSSCLYKCAKMHEKGEEGEWYNFYQPQGQRRFFRQLSGKQLKADSSPPRKGISASIRYRISKAQNDWFS